MITQKIWILWNTADDDLMTIYTVKPKDNFKDHLELREATITFESSAEMTARKAEEKRQRGITYQCMADADYQDFLRGK